MPGHDLQRLTGRRPTPPLIQINPAFVQRYLPHHNPEDNLHLELNTLYPSAGSSPSVTTFAMSPYSSSSLSLASLSAPQSPDGGDTCWNLIPYDVPWGSDYYAYKAGSLPGPEGDCLFLRSPTPVDKRRTVRACEKCRERKAKVCLMCTPRTSLTIVRLLSAAGIAPPVYAALKRAVSVCIHRTHDE
ncbi:hypothetical protein BC629DRAFT_71433 [Irpex lacteus]|nr:hypothetical protein BC629DRAFT_71433 [Irpex lacteus]